MGLDSQVIAAGHICLDVIPTFVSGVELPPPGQLWQVGPAVVSPGGSVSNTGLALHRLGIETRLMGKIGKDPFGGTLLDLVRAYDAALTEGIIVAPGETTAYTIVVNPPGLDRSFLHCAGANETFRASDLNLDLLARTRLFHLGYPPLLSQLYKNEGAELVRLLEKVKELGITTSVDMVMFDPHSPSAQADWPRILQRTLPFVDLFLPSIDELLLTIRPAEYARLSANGSIVDQVTPRYLREVADTLIAWGARIVLIKLAHRGIYLRTTRLTPLLELGSACPLAVDLWADRELWSPIFQVSHFGGTTGAGDAAIAGFLAALLFSCSPEEAVTFACAVGASNVEAPDALSGIQTWERTWARIKSGWRRVPLKLSDPDWRFDPARQLWVGRS